jgi:hypothetical protein
MSENILQSLIFGDEFKEDLMGLNLAQIGIGFNDFELGDADFDKKGKKSKSTEARGPKLNPNMKKLRKKEAIPTHDSQTNGNKPLYLEEKDMNLKLICEQDGEKIYKLSDLFIPLDVKITRKIERYNMKYMTTCERDKHDKEKQDEPKKEVNETDELKNLIKKAARNQKHTKINVTYNEKFFDKTFFLENLGAAGSGVNEQFNVRAREKANLKEGDLKEVKIPQNRVISDDIVEKNLLNSLYYVKKTLEKEEADRQANMPKFEIKANNVVENFEEGEIVQLNQNIKESFKFNMSNEFDPTNSQGVELMKSFSLNNSCLFDAHGDKDVSMLGRKQTRDSIAFKKEREKTDLTELYNRTKMRKHRQQGYFNESLLNGDYLNCLLLDTENINPKFKEISQKIYDLNDYNMNFEILETEPTSAKKESAILNQSINQSTMLNPSEDFVNNLASKNIAIPVNQQNTQNVLKIGKTKANLLTHAKCAYNLTYNKINLDYKDLKDFHRPNFCKYLLKEKKKRTFGLVFDDQFNISNTSNSKRWDVNILTRNYLKKKERKRITKNIQYMNAYEIFKDRYKLSLVDGKFALFEHIDENPLFVDNFGMASKLKKFLYTQRLFNSSVSNPTTKLTESELKTYNMVGPYGSQILLQPNQKLPLIGQIDTSESKGLTVVDNKMYRAPTFYEKLANPIDIKPTADEGKKYYNFLITFKKSKDGKNEGFYIRELEHNYVVAQEEPKIEVYPPQSRQYNQFLKKKIQTYTYKLYDQVGYKSGISFKYFTNMFPNVTEQILKKNFREMRIEIDKNICYFTKIPNEDNQMLITPENICQYESCQFGVYKLKEVGIKNLTNPDKISYAVNKFIQQTPDAKQQYLAKVIEEELLTTPWNITQNFIQAKQIKGMLAIKGIGDPSNGNGGYSFLKMPVKTYNDNTTVKEDMDILKSANKNIKTVTGTDADLRKLSKEDIKLKLIQLGYEDDMIDKLGRWDRVALLRFKSSEASKLGFEGDITKFARNSRMNSKHQRDAYQGVVNSVFKKQIDYITANDLSLEESDDDDEDDMIDYSYLETAKHEYPEEDMERNNIIGNGLKKKKKDGMKRLGGYGGDKKTDSKMYKLYKKNNEGDDGLNVSLGYNPPRR